MPKPDIMSQLMQQNASRPKPPATNPGAKFSGMENAMLKKLKPDPLKRRVKKIKKVAGEENQL